MQYPLFSILGCGDIFTRRSGNFTSPNYPNTYPHDVACEWTIITDYGNVVELTINDLDIEMSKDCFDKLVVSEICLLAFVIESIEPTTN